MADSERPSNRDDDVPEPQRNREVPAAANGGEVSRCSCHEEPDRGNASMRTWGRVIAEVVLWLIRFLQMLG
jgi:hypothetical protein